MSLFDTFPVYCCRMNPLYKASLLLTDFVTGMTYFVIGITLLVTVLQRWRVLPRLLLLLFGVLGSFILFCGIGHVLDMQIIVPNICYWKMISGHITAAVSVLFVLVLFVGLPYIDTILDFISVRRSL